MSAVLRADQLGRRYRKRWALQDCTLDVPEGSVVALVGPNGAGKTTLLHLAAGLLLPTEGTITVFGGDPSTEIALLARVGLVAQDLPLYRGFTVADSLRLGRSLNPRWDEPRAVRRLDELGIPLDQKVGTLSGGQRAQVALAIALAKRPGLLLLDEPLASLDPLARREFLQTLMLTAAEGDSTIVLSSHLITDLERVCDRMILLARGRVQLADSIDTLLASHRVVTGERRTAPIAGVAEIVDEVRTGRQSTMTVRTLGPILDPSLDCEEVGLEELVLSYLGRASGASPGVRSPMPDPIGAAS